MHDILSAAVLPSRTWPTSRRKTVPPFDRLDRQVVHRLDGVGGVVELHHILEAADLDVAGRRDLVLVGKGVLHIGGRQAARLHRLGIKIDLHRAVLAAIGIGHRGAAHRGQARAGEILRLGPAPAVPTARLEEKAICSTGTVEAL